MSREHDAMRTFRQAYLDYVEGLRGTPPSFDAFSGPDRRAAERWVKSLHAARGMDPFASRPSIADLLARARTSGQPSAGAEFEETLRSSLRSSVDPRADVVSDVASMEAGLASRLLVQARGLRVRVLIYPAGGDLDTVYGQRVAEVAAVFGAFPDTTALLLLTGGPEPTGAVVDKEDVVSAIETPSGQSSPPRIRRPVSDPFLACQQFFIEAMPMFEPFDYRAVADTDGTSELTDTRRLAAAAIEQIVAAGQRARLEAKQIAWSALGEREIQELSAWLKAAMHSRIEAADYRRRLDALVDVA
jgi:hypothetical protein